MLIRVTIAAALLFSSLNAASAQYGAYGLPDPVSLPATNPIMLHQDGYSQAKSYYGLPQTVRNYPPAKPYLAVRYPDRGYAAPSHSGSAGYLNEIESLPTGNGRAITSPGNPSGDFYQGDQGISLGSGRDPVWDKQIFGDCETCGERCGSCWYSSITGFVMGRDKPNRLWTSFETGNNPNQLLNTPDAQVDWGFGGELTLGRTRCGCGRVEFSYWTLGELDGFASITHPSTVSTPLIVSGIEFNGSNGTVIFDGAAEHRIWRENEAHSFEWTYLTDPIYVPGSRLPAVSFLAGFRYFRFDEELIFGSADAGGAFGGAGNDEAYIQDRITNDMFGAQCGLTVDYMAFGDWRFFATPKLGVYYNYITNRFSIYRGDGVVATPTGASGVTGSYPIRSHESVVSFLAQLDFGLEKQISQNLSVQLGYRIVGITGIGLADNQIPTYVVDIPEIEDIDFNGNLILHGAFASLIYRR